MGKKCRFCFGRLDEGVSKCDICKIDVNKQKKDLTGEDKKIADYCRTLWVVGLLCELSILPAVLIFGTTLYLVLSGEIAKIKMSPGVLIINNSIIFLLLLLYGIFGVNLVRYKRWCYKGGIILFSLSILMNLLRLNIIGLLFSGLFLYYLSSKTAKKILYRQLL